MKPDPFLTRDLGEKCDGTVSQNQSRVANGTVNHDDMGAALEKKRRGHSFLKVSVRGILAWDQWPEEWIEISLQCDTCFIPSGLRSLYTNSAS